MEMDIIDNVQAYTLEVGDYILFEGVICAIKEITESEDIYFFVSEDDRELAYFWWNKVDIYGYSEVDI